MKTLFLDTAYVIALLNSRDPHHDAAAEMARRIQASEFRLLTTTAILIELGDGFTRKGRWQVLEPTLDELLTDESVEVIEVDRVLTREAIALRKQRQDKQWGLTDCVSFVVMQKRRLNEALTADHHFEQAGFRALLLEA